jgi:hypothetical protein
MRSSCRSAGASLAIASAFVLCGSVARADEEAPAVIRGNGRGYSASIMIADVSAALVIPATILPTWSQSNPWIWSIPLSAAPVVLTGPLMHAAHGRWLAAAVSFGGWTSVVASSWFVGGLLSMMMRMQCVPDQRHPCATTQDLSALGAGLGITVGVAGTAGMTLLDGWMARPIVRTHVAPSVTFDGHGASAGLLGSF